jgi:hypothetical protein
LQKFCESVLGIGREILHPEGAVFIFDDVPDNLIDDHLSTTIIILIRSSKQALKYLNPPKIKSKIINFIFDVLYI